jgi:hypothetical protein
MFEFCLVADTHAYTYTVQAHAHACPHMCTQVRFEFVM